MACQENKDWSCKPDSEIVIIKAQDSNKDIETTEWLRSTPDHTGFTQTTNLTAKLELCVGLSEMLTDNTNVSDRLINSSLGIINHLDMRSKSLCSLMYVKFVDQKAGDSLKDRYGFVVS